MAREVLPIDQRARRLRPHRMIRALALLMLAAVLASCGSDTATSTPTATAPDATTTDATTTDATTTDTDDDGAMADDEAMADDAADTTVVPVVSTRDSGITVTVQEAGGVIVHTLTAPEAVFANSTHIFELPNSLVLVDTQFLLPNAQDFRAYADSLGKTIDRVLITHEHPDHFLGSEAFNDVPVFALAEVSDKIAASGDAEVAEKQADFGPAIASTFVVPEVVEPGTVEIDGVTFELDRVVDAEAEVQLVVRVPAAGAVVTGDVVYSNVHLVLAGAPDTWTAALEALAATGDEYPMVLAGHGLPADPSVYDANIEWLATAGQLLGAVDNGEDFKQGMIDAYPDYGMVGAIDLVLGFLFPEGSTDAATTNDGANQQGEQTMDAESQASLDTVMALMGAMGSGDMDTMAELIADDMVWQNEGDSAVPWIGPWEGKEAIFGFLGIFSSNFETTLWENEDVLASGDTVAVFGRMGARMTESGKETGEFTFALRAKVSDGKVVLWNWLEDSYAISQAYQG